MTNLSFLCIMLNVFTNKLFMKSLAEFTYVSERFSNILMNILLKTTVKYSTIVIIEKGGCRSRHKIRRCHFSHNENVFR